MRRRGSETVRHRTSCPVFIQRTTTSFVSIFASSEEHVKETARMCDEGGVHVVYQSVLRALGTVIIGGMAVDEVGSTHDSF
jgi:hypothetical protein